MGTYSGVFATITTRGGPLVGSGSITALRPGPSQINYRLTKHTTSSVSAADRIVDKFEITQGIGGYLGASGKFSITITEKPDHPNANCTILGRVKL